MKTNMLKTKITLINNKVKFSGCADGKEKIIVDYNSPIGNDEGHTSLELFLISAGTCLGTTIKLLVKNHLKKEITGMDITASGIRKEENPTYFKEINIVLDIACQGLNYNELEPVIKFAEKEICPVLGMLKDEIKISIQSNIK